MTREDAIVEAYMLATGKYAAISAISPSKRSLLTNLAIKYYREWQTEKGVEWDSLYEVVGAGTVTATDTFQLDAEINFISTASEREHNFVRVKVSDTNYINYKSVHARQLYPHRNENAVAKIADNQIQFSKAFTATEEAFGGTIEVPAIIKLDDITTDSAEILIDNPQWLPARMAAQYALGFKSLRQLYPDLLDQANELMSGMIEQNSNTNESTSTGVDYFSSMGNVGSTI